MGRGVAQDDVHAFAWYTVAESRGERTARSRRDALAQRMTRDRIELAEALAAGLVKSPAPR